MGDNKTEGTKTNKVLIILITIIVLSIVLLAVLVAMKLSKRGDDNTADAYDKYVEGPYIEHAVIDRAKEIEDVGKKGTVIFEYNVPYETAELVSEFNTVSTEILSESGSYQLEVMSGALQLLFEEYNKVNEKDNKYIVIELTDKAMSTAAVVVSELGSENEYNVVGDVLEGDYTITEK